MGVCGDGLLTEICPGHDEKTAQLKRIKMAPKTDNPIRFRLPGLPASMNQIYAINFGQRQVYLRPEVKRWKNDCKPHVPLWRPSGTGYISIELDFYGNWLYKNGKLKRADLQNLEKVTIDTICEKIGVDDKFIVHKVTNKIQSDDHDFVDVQMKLVGVQIALDGTEKKIPETRVFDTECEKVA